MGLDNSINVNIRAKNTNKVVVEIELCYFRKFWGLRNQIISILEPQDKCWFSLTKENLEEISSIFNFYSSIDNVIDGGVSTIWENWIEVRAIREARTPIEMTVDFLNNKISGEDYIDYLCYLSSENEGLLKAIQSNFEDYKIEFEFIDSY